MLQFLLFYAACIFMTTSCQAVNDDEYILELSSPLDTHSFINSNKHSIQHVRYVFDSDLFYGTAVQFKNTKVANQLIKTNTIINAWPIHHKVRTHAPITRKDTDDTTTTFYPQNKDTLELLTKANYFDGLKSNGQGIKIGIIDTGVDYTHPALGGCFGKGCKVAYGYDLVGNNYNGSSSSIKTSNDPIDNCPINSTSATGHGTFVSGIIGADDKIYNWTGVAPGATLGMWKVYGCNYASSPSDVLLKAMEMAYKADMDIISMSLGVSGGWEEDVLSVVADRLVTKGVHVITASGNSGTSGVFLTASPASGKNVIAAGSTMNNHVPGYVLKIFESSQKNETDIYYRTYVNSPLVLNDTLKVVASGADFNQVDDACKPLNGTFNQTIMLIHQGDCNSLTKIKHAKDAGAVAVLLYTDDKNQTVGFETLSTAVLPVAFINNDDAALIYSQNSTIKAQFTNTLVALVAPSSDYGMISGYSTLGPTNELNLKPELVAVGGNVFSTLPRYLNMYGFRSGTSFSAPYIAANVALLLSNVNRSIEPTLAKNILMNFANQVNKPISDVPYGDSPIRQGAGVVDVAQAIQGYEQFHVSPSVLSLNDSAHFDSERIITIYNHNDTDLEFTIDHLPSLTVTGYSLKESKFSYTPVEPIGLYTTNVTSSVAKLEFSSASVVVPAGKSVQVRVQIEPPVDTFKKEWHALYGGYITISTKDNQAYVPYMGMIGDMKDLPILDRSNKPSSAANYDFPSIGLPSGLDTLKSNETGEFHIKENKLGNVLGGPYILTRLLTGTSILQIQILNDDKEHVGDVPITNNSRRWMMRNTLTATDYSSAFYTWYWTGEYVPPNSTLESDDHEPKYLKSGTYYVKVRGLSVFGDRENPKDWDEWISPKLKLDIDL